MINPHYAKLNIMKVELDTKFQGKSKKTGARKKATLAKTRQEKKMDKR